MSDPENNSDLEETGESDQMGLENLSLNSSKSDSNRDNSHKETKPLGAEVSLDNYSNIKKLIQNCQSPSDTFKIFSTMIFNTLNHRNKVGRSFPKHLMEFYEEAMKDTSTRIAQLTKAQTRTINQDNNFQSLNNKMKTVDKKIDKLINNSEMRKLNDFDSQKENREQMGELLPKIQASLVILEEHYIKTQETLKNIKDSIEVQKQDTLETESIKEAPREIPQENNEIQRDPKTNEVIVHYIKITPLKEQDLHINMDNIREIILVNELPEPVNFSTNKQGKIFLHFLKKNEYQTVKDFLLNNPILTEADNLKVHKHSKQRTRLIIYNTFFDESDSFPLIKENLQDHEHLIESELEIIGLFDSPKKNRSHLIIEINKENADILLKKRKLNNNYHSFSLAQYIVIKKCTNCQEPGHYSGNCKNETKCNICGQNHKTIDCKTTDENCINCEKQGLIDLAHRANSKNCISFKNHKKEVFEKILTPRTTVAGREREIQDGNGRQ